MSVKYERNPQDISGIRSVYGAATQLVLKLFRLRDAGKNKSKVISSKVTYYNSELCVCVQYERTPQRGFRDLLWERDF